MRFSTILLVALLGSTALAEEPRRTRKPSAERVSQAEYPAFEFNLAAAAGSSGGQSFFEVQAGVNTVFLPWLVWRNAPFYRFRSQQSGLFGIDSSVLGRVVLGENFSFDAGGGYRLASDSQSAPFLEARAGLSFPRFFFQLGVKYLMNSLVRAGAANEFIYSVGASAGARL